MAVLKEERIQGSQVCLGQVRGVAKCLVGVRKIELNRPTRLTEAAGKPPRFTRYDRAPGPGQLRSPRFLRLAWMDPAQIQALDPRWNHYNTLRDDSRNVHFSHVREQPWKRPRHPLRPFWEGWLAEALEAGALNRGEIVKEVAKLHLHPGFLRHALP